METHSRADTRGYDLFKALVALGLLAAITFLLLRGQETAQVVTPPATATPAVAASAPAPTVAQIIPVLNAPDIFSDGSVTLRGTAAPGAVLAVLANGQQLDTVQAAPDGTWSYQGQLEPGDYTLTVQTLDAAGNVINEAAGVAASVPAPFAVPELEAPQVGADGLLALQGTAEPGATVEVVSDGVSLGTATAGADGTWSLDTRLDPGAYDLVVRTVDAEGNVVNESAAVAVQIPEVGAAGATAVPAEVVAGEATLELPEALAAGTVTLSGTGQPGSRVEVLVDGVSAGQATVGANRRWNLDLELPTPGDYSIVLQTLDASGALVAESVPAVLKILAAAGAEAAAALEAVVEQRVLTLTGTGEPGAEVEIMAGDEVVGTTRVRSDGTWTFTGEVAAGVEELVARFRDATGQVVSETEPVAVTDELAAAGAEAAVEAEAAGAFEAVVQERTVTLTGTGEPGTQVEIVAGDEVVGSATVADDGTWTLTGEVAAGIEELVARFRNANGRVLSETAPVKLRDVLAAAAAALPVFEAVLREGVLTLTGTGEPGAEVEIVAGDEVLGTVEVAEDGTWTFTGEIAAGVEELVARLRDAAGAVIAESKPVAVVAAEAAGAAAEEAAEAVAPAFEAVVEEGVLTATGTGEPGAEVEIVAGDEVLGKVQVAEDGTWTFTGEVAAGVEELVARLRDAAGRVIAESAPVAVAAAEAAGAAAEAVAAAVVPAFEAVVREGVLTVTGTGEPGTDVEIVSGDQVLGTVPVAEDGTWTFTGEVVADVEELVARLRDAAGRVVAESEPVVVAGRAPVSTGRVVSTPTAGPSGAARPAGRPPAGPPGAAKPSGPAPEGQVYIVRPGDWLSSIADRLYRNAKAYPRIVAATNLKAAKDSSFQEITDPDLIYPGQKLWLPVVTWSP